MLTGVLALLERSLRVDARAWGPHLARLGLMLCIYAAVAYTAATSDMFGAPGLRFFRSTVYLNIVFMTLLGIGYFSTAVTEEKEEDTLGLMLMAGISPLSLLLGKSVGRLVQALLLVAIQYPFTLLAVTMGGVTQDQVRSIYLSLLSYLVLLSGLGLFFSTMSSRNRTASLRLLVFLIGYALIPGAAGQLLINVPIREVSLRRLLSSLSESSVLWQVENILTSSFSETVISVQVISNLVLGGLGYLLSWLLFAVATREFSTESESRGLTTRRGSLNRLFSAGRPQWEPFLWKDFHFVAGGLPSIMLRAGLYYLIYLLSVALTAGWIFSGVPSTLREQTDLFLAFSMLAVAMDAGLLVSRSITAELRGQTLTSLLMTPNTIGHILYTKIAGALAVWLPGPIALLYGIFGLQEGYVCTKDFFYHMGAPLWLIGLLVLIPHTAAVAATFSRWGALPIAIGASIGAGFLSGSYFNAIQANDDAPQVYFVAILFFVLSGCCHLIVWLRVEHLASK